MKQKTSVSLSQDVLEELDRCAGSGASRSAYIERVLRHHFRRRARLEINERDRELLDASADQLNREAADVLEFQSDWSAD